MLRVSQIRLQVSDLSCIFVVRAFGLWQILGRLWSLHMVQCSVYFFCEASIRPTTYSFHSRHCCQIWPKNLSFLRKDILMLKQSVGVDSVYWPEIWILSLIEDYIFCSSVPVNSQVNYLQMKHSSSMNFHIFSFLYEILKVELNYLNSVLYRSKKILNRCM